MSFQPDLYIVVDDHKEILGREDGSFKGGEFFFKKFAVKDGHACMLTLFTHREGKTLHAYTLPGFSAEDIAVLKDTKGLSARESKLLALLDQTYCCEPHLDERNLFPLPAEEAFYDFMAGHIQESYDAVPTVAKPSFDGTAVTLGAVPSPKR